MNTQHRTGKGYAKAVGIGVATSIITFAAMFASMKAGISPMPKPLGLAFAQRLLGEAPMPVGLLFHVAYVTFWSVVFVVMFDRYTLARALGFAIALWVLVLVFFFPFVGWGPFGMGVGPKLIPGSLAPHVLFAVALWLLCRWAFHGSAAGYVPRRAAG